LFFFTERKRRHIPKYNFTRTKESDGFLRKAVALSKKYGCSPASLASRAYELVPRKEYFTIADLCHKRVEEELEQSYGDQKEERSSRVQEGGPEEEEDFVYYDANNIQVTNTTLEYEGRWTHQLEKVKRRMAAGYSIEHILMDTSNKLHGWFRILVTEQPMPDVIAKFRLIALKELNPRLTRFIQDRGLNLNRIK